MICVCFRFAFFVPFNISCGFIFIFPFVLSDDGFSERWCYVVTSNNNLHEKDRVCSCNHLTHFAVLVDYNGIQGVITEFWSYLQHSWYNPFELINILFYFNKICVTAHQGGHNHIENYHLRWMKPFHDGNIFDNYCLFLPNVSTIIGP